MNTPARAIRIPTDLWKAARAKATREGTTVTAIVIAALRRYVAAGMLGALVLVSVGGTSQASAPSKAAAVNWGWNCMTMGTKVCDSSYRTVDWGMADMLSGTKDMRQVGLPNRFRHWEDCKVSSDDYYTTVVCPDGFTIDWLEDLI